MTDTATVVTLGDCQCGTTYPHRKFYQDGVGLHDDGFFSVEAGVERLVQLIDDGIVNPSDRNRLLSELGKAGLPATRDDATANTLAVKFGYRSSDSLESVLASLAPRGLTTEVANKVRAKIRALTDDEKIAGAVLALQNVTLGDPDLQEVMAEEIDPAILDRVRTQVEEAAVNDTAKKYGFLGAVALEGAIGTLVEAEMLTAEMTDKVRSKVKTMTEDERIESGVLSIRDRDLGDPQFKEDMARDIEPGLLERITAGAEDYQAANPPLADPIAEFIAALGGRAVGGNDT